MIKLIDLRCGKDSSIFESLASRSQLEHKDVLDRVEEIVGNVRRNGDKAVLEYTAMFDKAQLTSDKLRVTEEEIKEAYTKVDPKLIEVIKKSRDNIRDFMKSRRRNPGFPPIRKG
ncbi:histidinol dehydrogenase [Acetivibrio straminisolvens JCM 21531]|uniref:Histidinol dehydrogenase n=1 Tax=Acetivibrio straminisolvens JCM 21531 TaxID=1294263 RepID=W4V549_9FIRM|nr:histidinol dehydrogenase [Acetivibrio straminisolvens JCM 21531]